MSMDVTKTALTPARRRLIEQWIATLNEEQKSNILDYWCYPCSLNDRFEDKDGRTVELIDILDQEEYLLCTGVQSRPWEELRALAIDMAIVLDGLPPDLRDLCQRMETETVMEISRDTGVPSEILYESIKKIRDIFENAGLKDYL